MALQSIDPTQTKAWKKLQAHFDQIKKDHIKDWFVDDTNRANRFTIKWDDFFVDYSKNRITQQTIDLFLELAEEINLQDAITKYFSGDKINQTENKAVLHTALRAPKEAQIYVDGENVIPKIHDTRENIKTFTDRVINGDLTGFTGKPFTDIVNIGIGGSNLGPSMVVHALSYYKNHLNTHFVSNIDGDHVHETLKTLNPETTLFIVVSKSFTTQETLLNANTIKQWFLQSTKADNVSKHFVAVTAKASKAQGFGINKENIFPTWDWVGGRFSLWSAVGLSISLSIGYNNFNKLLLGAQKTDTHFKNEPFTTNIPVMLAFLSVWYNNFFKAETEAIIPYTQYLSKFSAYLQQAIMESNGKMVMRNGKEVTYQTGNIIWGAPGTNSQHAFFQLLHQGTKLIPADFIGFKESLHGDIDHHDKLISNFIAQTEALLKGKTKEEVITDFEITNTPKEDKNLVTPFKVFEGNKPTTTIFINKLTPESLGKLIALYEHKIFVQGVIWNIFSYDQFGVELGKQMATSVLEEFKVPRNNHKDCSTKNLIEHYKNKM